MATPVRNSRPPSPPTSAPPVSVTAARPNPWRLEFHPTRPFKYGWSLLRGAVTGLLDGAAGFGRKGFWAGAGLGIVMGIATGTIVPVMMGAVIGLLGGAALGGALGAIYGGYSDVTRTQRRDKFADEVNERQVLRSQRETRTATAAARGSDYDDAYGARQRAANFNFERAQQQERENNRDYNTYWQDREDSRPHHHGRGV